MAQNIPDGYGVAKIRFRCTGDPEEMVSTFGFQHDGTTDPQATAQALSEGWVEAWPLTDLSANYTHVGVDVAIGPPGEALMGEYNTSQVGATPFNPCPSNCALLVSKITAQQGKGSRGRVFLPAGHLSEQEVDQNGFLANGALAQAGTNAFRWWQAAQDNGGDMAGVLAWVLFHGGGTMASDFGPGPNVVTAFSVQTQIATQRQRMRR